MTVLKKSRNLDISPSFRNNLDSSNLDKRHEALHLLPDRERRSSCQYRFRGRGDAGLPRSSSVVPRTFSAHSARPFGNVDRRACCLALSAFFECAIFSDRDGEGSGRTRGVRSDQQSRKSKCAACAHSRRSAYQGRWIEGILLAAAEISRLRAHG